jgi:hypothetical protein
VVQAITDYRILGYTIAAGGNYSASHGEWSATLPYKKFEWGKQYFFEICTEGLAHFDNMSYLMVETQDRGFFNAWYVDYVEALYIPTGQVYRVNYNGRVSDESGDYFDKHKPATILMPPPPKSPAPDIIYLHVWVPWKTINGEWVPPGSWVPSRAAVISSVHVGHAALQIGKTYKDSSYLSFWPKNEAAMEDEGTFHTLADDSRIETYPPNVSIAIGGLDVAKIQKFLDAQRALSPPPFYTLTESYRGGDQCASMVWKALAAGGAPADLVNKWGLIDRIYGGIQGVSSYANWTPFSIVQVGNLMRQGGWSVPGEPVKPKH